MIEAKTKLIIGAILITFIALVVTSFTIGNNLGEKISKEIIKSKQGEIDKLQKTIEEKNVTITSNEKTIKASEDRYRYIVTKLSQKVVEGKEIKVPISSNEIKERLNKLGYQVTIKECK